MANDEIAAALVQIAKAIEAPNVPRTTETCFDPRTLKEPHICPGRCACYPNHYCPSACACTSCGGRHIYG